MPMIEPNNTPSGGCESGTSVVCTTDVPNGAQVGRRIYVHEDSLRDLAFQSQEAGALVYTLLGRVVAVKVANHTLSDAVTLHDFPASDADAIVLALRETWARDVSAAARRIGSKQRAALPEPLLGEGESIVATCYFGGYYTFATDERSSRAMFADVNPIATIVRMQSEGSAYEDLRLIRGSVLRLLDTPFVPQRRRLTAVEADAIRNASYATIEDELSALLAAHVRPEQRDVVASARTILREAFSRSVLRESANPRA